MVFPIGSVKTLCCACTSEPEEWVAVLQDHAFMVGVTQTTVQLWTTGLNSVRLRVVNRNDKDDLEASGLHIDAHWCSIKSALAVLVRMWSSRPIWLILTPSFWIQAQLCCLTLAR